MNKNVILSLLFILSLFSILSLTGAIKEKASFTRSELISGSPLYGCLSTCLCVNRHTCLTVCLSTCLPAYPSFCLPICLLLYLSVCLPVICLLICLSACLFVCLSVLLPVCPSVCLPVYLFVCLPVCLPVGQENINWYFLAFHLSACLSGCLFVSLSVFLPICLSACPLVSLPAWLHVCLSVYLPASQALHLYCISIIYLLIKYLCCEEPGGLSVSLLHFLSQSSSVFGKWNFKWNLESNSLALLFNKMISMWLSSSL